MIRSRLHICLTLSAWLNAVIATQQLTWSSPTSEDAYKPGDTILGEWSSDKSVVSPSVSLCTSDSNSDDSGDDSSACGGTVWPSIEQNGNQYSFSLAAPSVTSETDFYLRMKDDFGNVIKSPTFVLSPSAVDNEATSATGEDPSGNTVDSSEEEDPAVEASSSTPIPTTVPSDAASAQDSSDVRDASKGSNSSPPSQVPSTSPMPGSHKSRTASAGGAMITSHDTPAMIGSASGFIPSSSSPESNTPSNSVNLDSASVSPAQYAIASNASVPAAAVAVPLALVAATVLASLVLFWLHRRSLAAQRERNAHLIDLQRGASIRSTESKAASLASNSYSDPGIEKAISALKGTEGDSQGQQQRVPTTYEPAEPQYPIPRTDVRRERSCAYDRSYERPYTHTYDRPYYRSHDRPREHFYDRAYDHPPFESRSRPASIRHPLHRPWRTPRTEYDHHRSYSRNYRGHSIRRHDFDDDEAATESVLSGYLSPPLPEPQVTHFDYDYRCERPLAPPRSHSRHTAPEMEDTYYSHYRPRNVYDSVERHVNNASYARTNRSV